MARALVLRALGAALLGAREWRQLRQAAGQVRVGRPVAGGAWLCAASPKPRRAGGPAPMAGSLVVVRPVSIRPMNRRSKPVASSSTEMSYLEGGGAAGAKGAKGAKG